MSAPAIDQLGLSPASQRVLQAHLDSSLSGRTFLVGLVTAYVVTAIMWTVGAGVIGWSLWLAIEQQTWIIGLAGLVGLPFLLIPIAVLSHLRRLDRARRG